jgi:hypothetical protein
VILKLLTGAAEYIIYSAGMQLAFADATILKINHFATVLIIAVLSMKQWHLICLLKK